jgi:hypothetical protein
MGQLKCKRLLARRDAYPNIDFEVSYPGGAKQFNIM